MKLKVILNTRKSKEGKYKNSREVLHAYAYITMFSPKCGQGYVTVSAGCHLSRVWTHSAQAPGISEVFQRRQTAFFGLSPGLYKQEGAT